MFQEVDENTSKPTKDEWENIPSFLTRTGTPGVFKIMENTIGTTPSSSVTDVGVSNAPSTMINRSR